MKNNLVLSLIYLLLNFNSFAAWQDRNYSYGGENRFYRLYLPSNFSVNQSYSLVLGIHGLGDDATNFSNALYEFKNIADTANVILAFPQGLNNAIIGNGWNAGAGTLGIYPSPNVDDIGFINSLAESLQAEFPIIKKQTYIFGFSNGGFMVEQIACESNGLYSAIASIAGTIGNLITQCNPNRKIPILHFHGTADANVGYYSNAFGINTDSLMALWAYNNACDTPPTMTNVPDIKADGYTVEHYVYNNCQRALELFKVNDAAHIILTEAFNDISYSREMWRFFRENIHEVLTEAANVEKINHSLMIYPNPSNNVIFIQNKNWNPNEKLEVYVTNVSGQVIHQKEYNNLIPLKLNTTSFPEGTYFIKVKSDLTYTGRFTIIRN